MLFSSLFIIFSVKHFGSTVLCLKCYIKLKWLNKISKVSVFFKCTISRMWLNVSAALLSWGWNAEACCCSKGLKAYHSCFFLHGLLQHIVFLILPLLTFVRFIGLYVLLLTVTSLIGCCQRCNMPESFNLERSAASTHTYKTTSIYL